MMQRRVFMKEQLGADVFDDAQAEAFYEPGVPGRQGIEPVRRPFQVDAIYRNDLDGMARHRMVVVKIADGEHAITLRCEKPDNRSILKPVCPVYEVTMNLENY